MSLKSYNVARSARNALLQLINTGIVASKVAAKLNTIISFCRFPSLSKRFARSKKFIRALPKQICNRVTLKNSGINLKYYPDIQALWYICTVYCQCKYVQCTASVHMYSVLLVYICTVYCQCIYVQCTASVYMYSVLLVYICTVYCQCTYCTVSCQCITLQYVKLSFFSSANN